VALPREVEEGSSTFVVIRDASTMGTQDRDVAGASDGKHQRRCFVSNSGIYVGTSPDQ
jgi:hypothetical protein